MVSLLVLKLLISVAGHEIDYTRYLVHSQSQNGMQPRLRISEQINIPSQMTFSLTPCDGSFVVPRQRAYVQLYSSQFDRSVFTGYIVSEPVRVYLAAVRPGLAPDPVNEVNQIFAARIPNQLFEYQIICTSDEHILNIKAVPFIPAFVNRGQGQILASLANILCGSGFYDTSNVASGDLVPFFQYDPRHSWSEVAKTFGDGARYRYKARDRQIYYQPYGDQPLGIAYDEGKGQGTFDPKGLQTTVLSVPIVNDVTIIGDAEAGNSREDYFIGSGFDANFPLQHKVFKGSSSLLLQESWSNKNFSQQQWLVQDPGTNFDLSAGALNIITPASGAFPASGGQSFIGMNNGLELAGGIDLEHGEYTFNDKSFGIVGGIYPDTTYAASSLIAGFQISTPASGVTYPHPSPIGGVIIGGLGVGGVQIQALYNGSGVGPVFATQVNHTYVLQTVVTAPKYTRYDRIYRTVEGEQFGGATSKVHGSLTFMVQDFDVIAATGIFYAPQVSSYIVNDVDLPAFATYAPVNNQRLNVTIANTTIAIMPLGTLAAMEGPSGLFMPTGAILPMLPANSGDFIGPVLSYADPSSGTILPGPLMLGTGQTQLVLGNGLNLQSAQITQGNEADTLAFYVQTTPAAGTPVRFQSWESQAAVSRLQDQHSIQTEAFVVGDDGLRSAVVSDLNPLPRTSEDCDNAALALLTDRVGTFYNGSYNCTSLFFTPLTSDQQFYPTVGRFLNVHAPRRGIVQQKYLVTNLTITIRDLVSELLDYSIQFGADLYLEKVLKNFVDLQPLDVLAPKDKANPPNPRFTQNVTKTFIPDLQNVQVDMTAITDTSITVKVIDNYFGPIEIRKIDANWGGGATFDYITTLFGPSFTLPRLQYDQTWFLRPNVEGVLSRRSKVLRVRYPTNPDTPEFVNATQIQGPVGETRTVFTTFNVQFGFAGDQRNIYGFELRAADDTTILVQKPANSFADLGIDLTQTPFPLLPNPLNRDYTLFAYFFNHQWSYSSDALITEDLIVPRIVYPWSPAHAFPFSGDNAFLQTGHFGIQPTFDTDADGNRISTVLIKGRIPPSQLSKHVGPPVILASSGTGGLIPGGTYEVALNAYDRDPSLGPTYGVAGLSDVDFVTIPASGQGTIITTILDWDKGSWGGELFISSPSSDYGWHREAIVPKAATTVTVGYVSGLSYGAPDLLFDHFGVQLFAEIHGGIWAQQVDAVGQNSLQFFQQSFTVNQFAGRTITLLGHIDALLDLEVANFAVTGNSVDTIFIGPSQYGGNPPDLSTFIVSGDVVMMRMIPSNITASGFGDPLLINSLAPNGLNPGDEVGTLVMVLEGPGSGQILPVLSNTATGFNLGAAWNPPPTSASLVVTASPSSFPEFRTARLQTINSQNDGVVAEQNLTNLANQVWLVQVYTEDKFKVRSTFPVSREIFVLGQPENGLITPRPWRPYYIPANPAPGVQALRIAGGMGLQLGNATLADGSTLAEILIYGYPPQNNFSTQTTPPEFTLSFTPSGGFINGGQEVTVGMYGFGPDQLPTDLTIHSIVLPLGSSSYQINVDYTLADSDSDGGVLLAGPFAEAGLSEKFSVGSGSPNPAIISDDRPTGRGGPDRLFDHFILRATPVLHGGIWGGPILAVSPSGSPTTLTIGGSWQPHQLQGRIMSLIGKADNSIMRVIDKFIQDNDATSVLLDADLSRYLASGDIIEIRTAPDTFTWNTIGDSLFVNGGAGQAVANGGLDPDDSKSKILWILSGAGAGQMTTVASNSSGGLFTVDPPFTILPGPDSVFVIVQPGWPYSTTTPSIQVNELIDGVYALPVDNSSNMVYLVQVVTADANGNTGFEWFSPVREIFQPGIDSGVGTAVVPTRGGTQL